MKYFFIISILIFICYTHLSVSLSQDLKQSDIQCLKSYNFTSINQFLFQDSYYIPSVVTNLRTAYSMNMSTDLLFYAYRPQPGAMQLNFCLQYISSKYYHTIWIMLITDDDYWEEYRPNCQYIKEIVHAIKAKGKKAGILTSRKWWETNVEADCNDLGTQPLWYQGDSQQNYSDFVPFGGWTKPSLKQTVKSTKCNIATQIQDYFYENYYE